ncbi:hypothetical protein D6D23_09793 [Aureobasidium pullulans]|nr:hypothetical protein D6D23_09793 [Aureobasidium pullulans]
MGAMDAEYKEMKEYVDTGSDFSMSEWPRRYKGLKENFVRIYNRTPELAISRCMRRTSLMACAFVVMMVFFWNSIFNGSGVSNHELFPRKIWQTWKVDVLDFEEKHLKVARSWTNVNPSFRYEVLTDQNSLAWVEYNFGPDRFNRLDIIYMYKEITAKIIKADLLRYLVMYVEGGVYTDIDVEAIRPVQRFIPERWNERDIDMVVGVEIDEPEWKDHPILGPKSQSFCQWTFMCKPQLRVMMDLVENIMDWLRDEATKQRVPIGEIKLDFDQVISGTGPSAFTKAILADMSRKTGRDITWNTFHGLDESKVVGNVLVLTVEAFAAGQGHSDSGTHDTKQALVKHHYHASQWPKSHPRYKHPIFGEIEECNWKPECVHRWDEDKAAFEALDPAEQKRRIDEKLAKDKIEEEEKRLEEERKHDADREQADKDRGAKAEQFEAFLKYSEELRNKQDHRD